MKTKELIQKFLANPCDEHFELLLECNVALKILRFYHLETLKKNLSLEMWKQLLQRINRINDYFRFVWREKCKTFEERVDLYQSLKTKLRHTNQNFWVPLVWDLAKIATTADHYKFILEFNGKGKSDLSSNFNIYREDGNEIRMFVVSKLKEIASCAEDWIYVYSYAYKYDILLKLKAKKLAIKNQETFRDKFAVFKRLTLLKIWEIENWEKREPVLAKALTEFQKNISSLEDLCLVMEKLRMSSSDKVKYFLEPYNPTFEEMEQLVALDFDSSGVQGYERDWLHKNMNEMLTKQINEGNLIETQ